ncbi:MAG: hypothetical protein EON92_01630 [Burkholderiales bacterium]|nr:MAG: hypothetical protein EON92_01630 [Burkholderiales bacterium]
MKHLPAFLLAACSLAVHAQSSCSSDGQPVPAALLERFTNADCAGCWIDPATPKAARGDLALDWMVPGTKGDDAPMSAVALQDAATRLQSLGQPVPGVTAFLPRKPRTASQPLRVALGQPYNDYIGVSMEFRAATRGPWTAWLVLVETLPAGTEGSVVERNLVRNALQVEWRRPASGKLVESRAMSLPEGIKPERLRVAGWVEDSAGRIGAMAVSACPPPKK